MSFLKYRPMQPGLCKRWFWSLWIVSCFVYSCLAAPYDPREEAYNLNQNKTATDPKDYWGEWENHDFYPSPDNWRFPIYTIALDKWVDGDPTNNEANGTVLNTTCLGIKAIYLAGTPFINLPWGADQYSPLDFTILDHHLGTINDWRETVEEMHKKDMYLIVDLTVATLADLVGFEGYLNTTAPFTFLEHNAVWKSSYRYPDWTFENAWDRYCTLPEFWGENGHPVHINWVGCYASDFDQYGDTEAFGDHPDYQRQLSKFASVQDRLREWNPSVAQKLKRLSCLVISMLDVDGFRIDKATQMTVGFLADWAESVRECAKKFNKNNFFIPGEVTGSSSYGSIYYGRGRQPDQRPATIVDALNVTWDDNQYFLRNKSHKALDAAAFHYSIYRSLNRFLGMDGLMEISYDLPVDFVDAWHNIAINEDCINAYTGKPDPRHLYGVSNYDVFRWASVANGTQRLILGTMITFFLFPGAPLIYYGDEQGLYVLDNTADNYLYGRQAMTSAIAWYLHGCYTGSSSTYPAINLDPARKGCYDSWNTLDHFDSSKEERQVYMALQNIRNHYPAVAHGWKSEKLGNWTHDEYLPNSGVNPTTIGLFSVVRGSLTPIQDLSVDYPSTNKTKRSSSDVWLLYMNHNTSKDFVFDCSSSEAILAPWAAGITIKNLVYPYDEYTLSETAQQLGDTPYYQGCLPNLTLSAFAFKIFVPVDEYIARPPTITKFTPRHDARILNTGNTVNINLEFSDAMDCDSIYNSISIESKNMDNVNASIDPNSISCQPFSNAKRTLLNGQPGSSFAWTAALVNVTDGVHRLTVKNVSNADKSMSTGTTDHFLLRVGKADNPMVFNSANYSTTLLFMQNDTLYINHTATGADLFRYSLDFGSNWSSWQTYSGGMTPCQPMNWTGTKHQRWGGYHVKVQYWSKLTGSANHIQEGDYDFPYPRRFPHVYLNSENTQWGYDADDRNKMSLMPNGSFKGYFISDYYPRSLQFNVWGINSNGKPDQSFIYGDPRNSSVLVRMDPSSLTSDMLYITDFPPSKYLSWAVTFDPQSRRYYFHPTGSSRVSLAIYILSVLVPLTTALLAVFLFKMFFYQVKFNDFGKKPNDQFHFFPLLSKKKTDILPEKNIASDMGKAVVASEKRKCVLLATLEYDIADLDIRIKIGGLGVMAQLMSKHLTHEDIIWVVPCVGDVNYPEMEVGEPIIYVLLDAPVFRRQSTKEPYPPRVDDLSSAIFYSAWNQCIAAVLKRNPVDIYHINDYHGALAPIYLLPDVIPVAMSLHNAEFQGLWPLRTVEEKDEVCSVFNIPVALCNKYVQFGSVFNLLHAGASYIRIHQKGYGVVGVSKKYGKRSWARYPIFWGLKKIGKLPNPDPSDAGEQAFNLTAESIDEAEAKKAAHKRQAQEWAHLDVDPDADLLVFVGRWTLQKGIDLIADVAPAILENYKAQIIVIGPVIDLYGKFAAEKFSKLMEKYPGRLFSRPVFTQLPGYIFSGADFALIPSRDEPFGLVAVEFGRKGALGIGARVGGLGQMPGWWYTVESNATKHLLHQFEQACRQALSSSKETRARLRAISATQRFPVSEWVARLDLLVNNCIAISKKYRYSKSHFRSSVLSFDFKSKSKTHVNELEFTSSSTDLTSIVEDSAPAAADSLPSDSNQEQPSSSNSADAASTIDPYLGRPTGPGHTTNSDEATSVTEDNSVIDSSASDFPESIDESRDAIKARLAQIGATSELANTSLDSLYSEFDPQRPTLSELIAEEAQLAHPPVAGSGEGFVHVSSQKTPALATPNLGESSQPTRPLSMPPIGNAQTPKALNESRLSLASVMSAQRDFALTKVARQFDDEEGRALHIFSEKLNDLNAKNSKDELCIELFLLKCEKDYFDEIRKLQLGIQKPGKLKLVDETQIVESSPSFPPAKAHLNSSDDSDEVVDVPIDEHVYTAPRLNDDGYVYEFEYYHGISKFMQYKIFDWPVYAIFLALGQILAATSFQLSLLAGSSGQSESQFYIVNGFYIGATLVWYYLYVNYPSVYPLIAPFLVYAVAFFLIGIASFSSIGDGRVWIARVGTWIYSIGSGSQALFFSLNFGDDGSYDIVYWVFRACLVQGTQQIWAAALWYWGSYASSDTTSTGKTVLHTVQWMPGLVWPISILLGAVAYLLYRGLPSYYRQLPGKMPAFYHSIMRRRLIIWFFIANVLQNYWMASMYGRSWSFMWASPKAKKWAIFLLILLFYIGIWVVVMSLLAMLSNKHSWFIPIFGLGLGAPRWLQTLWGTSNIGIHLPYFKSAAPYMSRMLWLWLGLLDSVQGIGIGLILLQTLTRRHITIALMIGQIIGAAASMIGRASSPDRVGPSNTFVDFSYWEPGKGSSILHSAPFWVCLFCQLVVIVGYFMFFRRENLNRP
ncbi:cell wall alpha-1,3-glucan synthase mok11 [Schizosaccharomyces japonicus yFS275]|uniref:alpha-1,3-glucan synthase n=1 Tax=Schizosaccharomyces japonicus (strain yFS275 / FY16936) TaxID=402676 RepID=B6JXA4_SCHJY|nr:cell wall alpha-1,3-glucan synthase mok11 [Schizosaccharomyces japonicus yFS275]EEB06005.2 cell wall alpha-1,3-glucan synthase mok11 [Schizosaccharomyces japonicus yFS275]